MSQVFGLLLFLFCFFLCFFLFFLVLCATAGRHQGGASLSPSLPPSSSHPLPPSISPLPGVCLWHRLSSPLRVCVCVCVCVRACVRALLWPPPPPCASLSASAAELSQHASPLCSLSLSLCTCFSHYLHISAHHNLFLSFLLFF